MDEADRAEFYSTTYNKFLLQRNSEIVDHLKTPRTDASHLCVDCGNPIPEKRLEIFPGALRCVRCQEKIDSEGK